MSSGTVVNPRAAGDMIAGLSGKVSSDMARIARLGMTPRQQALNQLWAWYRCQHYDARKIDWNGREVLDPLEHEVVASSGIVPPGFVDARDTLPIKFRRPSAPYALVKVIVNRFTGLLFSERMHPEIRVEGDLESEDYVKTLAEEARLWPSMIVARSQGGAMGTACLGFQFLGGKPTVEVHDPRWVRPVFEDRSALRLSSIEKRYIFPMEVPDPDTGIVEQVPYWYRRTIDGARDVLYKPVPVGDGEEPRWEVEREVIHNFGFCPVVWVKNLPVEDDLDGDPDAHGIYDTVEAIDALVAQANKGTVANCDPTLVMEDTEGMQMSEISKGSDNAIKLPKGRAKYLEMVGTGPKSALDMAEILRKLALEVAQCVLEHPNTNDRTALEVERSYASMLTKADMMREQYGEKCVLPLLAMMLAAARKLEAARIEPGVGVVRAAINLPARVVAAHGQPSKLVPRRAPPDNGQRIKLQWPRYFSPSLQDINTASQSAGSAKVAGLIDAEHASNFVAEFFGVEDVPAMLKRVEEQARQQRDAFEQGVIDDLHAVDAQGSAEPGAGLVGAAPPSVAAAPGPEKAADLAMNGAQVTSALDILDRVATRKLPRASGIKALIYFFNLPALAAEEVMGDVGQTFFTGSSGAEASGELPAVPSEPAPAPPQ